MRTVLIGVARMGSTRQPGKVLFDLGGKPVLQWVIDAARRTSLLDDFIIATTIDPKDDAIAAWCESQQVKCFRGEVNDISPGVNDLTKRMIGAAAVTEADIVIIRVTCDCPFLDPHVIDQVIALREATGADYASNIDPPTWPDGLDCEAFTIEALRIVNAEATTVMDRNCVTAFIYHNQHRFKCETLVCPLPGMHKERWVLDTENDYKLCQAIAEGCPDGGWLNIKRFLDANPHLRTLNSHHPRNERYFAALASEPLPPRVYTNSQKLLTRAEKTIPLAAQTFSKSKIQYPSESPLFVTHGDGGYCYDVDGNRYVDLVGGLLPVILGHRDPDVDYAVRRQLNKGNCFSLATELEAELSETLCRLIPCAEMVRFGKNGSDVTSAAVRLARAVTGRSDILSCGYHGWADWTVAKDPLRNNGVVDREHTIQLEPHAKRVPYHGSAAVVIVEPETNPEWLKELRTYCDETGALLIFDEVITGFRFDLGGAQKLYGVTPDLACFGKSMANGWPISALVGKREYMETMERISYSGTFFGDPIAIAAAIVTIEKLEREDVLTKILDRQRQLHDACIKISHEIKSPPFVKITGEMHLPRLQFVNNDIKTLFIQEMAQQGVLIIASHNLSYAHDDNCIKRVVTAYQNVLPMLAEAIKTNSVRDRIKGRPIPAHANVRAS